MTERYSRDLAETLKGNHRANIKQALIGIADQDYYSEKNTTERAEKAIDLLESYVNGNNVSDEDSFKIESFKESIEAARDAGADITPLIARITPDLASKLLKKRINDNVKYLKEMLAADPNTAPVGYHIPHSIKNYLNQARRFGIFVDSIITRSELEDLTTKFEETYSPSSIKYSENELVAKVCEIAFA